MRSVAISTIGILGILCLGAKAQTRVAPAVHEKMPDRPPSGSRVRLQTSAWGASWDWNQDAEGQFAEITRSVHRGLYRISPQGSLEKDLADAETASADARIWTFRIRSGIDWSDGAPLTAQHFVDGVLRAADPTVAKIPEALKNIQGIEDYHFRKTPDLKSLRVISDRVFEVTLTRPDPLFPLKWLDTCLMPARGDLATLNSKSYGFDPEKMAFLGKFVLKDSRPGLRTFLVPNPKNPGIDGAVRAGPNSQPIQRLELWHTPNLNQARNLFDRGHLDLSLAPLQKAKTGKNVTLESTTLTALLPLSARAKNRWSNLAVSAALDRSKLPGIVPSLDWVPPVLWKLQGIGDYPSDAHLDTLSLQARPSLAKALLKQAGGFNPKQPIRIAIDSEQSARNSARNPQLLEAIRKQISNSLAIPVQIVSRDAKNPKSSDWILKSWSSRTWSIESYLESVTGDSTWNDWNEIPASDPLRLSQFLEKTKMALVETPVLIPLGFELKELRAKNYLNPLVQLGTGEVDITQLSFEPKSLERPKRRPQP